MKCILIVLFFFFLAGCATPPEPAEPVVDQAGSMEYLQQGLRPEMLYFPDYLLMADFELFQHGMIPKTELIGAGMRTPLALAEVRRRFSDAVTSNGWKIDKMEMGGHSFRLMASMPEEELEIRAVQGRGATQIFLLYHPKEEPIPMEPLPDLPTITPKKRRSK